MTAKNDAPSLLKGTLDVMILKSLTWGPMHGYDVTRWIRQQTRDRLHVDDAALYQALYRMERRGWLRAEWGRSENNRRAKFYQLTAAGRRELRAQTAAMRHYAQALLAVLEADGG